MSRVPKVPEELRGERVVLRRHKEEDIEPFALMIAEERTRYLLFSPEQRTPPGAEGLMRGVMQAYGSPLELFSLTIADPATDAFLGIVNLIETPDADVEVSYSILPEAEGKGFATEALNVLSAYSAERRVRALVAFCSPQDKRGQKVAERAGFKRMGLKKQYGMLGVRFEKKR